MGRNLGRSSPLLAARAVLVAARAVFPAAGVALFVAAAAVLGVLACNAAVGGGVVALVNVTTASA
jgi:hypothetical protein